LQPNYPDALDNLGDALRQQGKTADAISLYERALQCAPGYPPATLRLGQAFLEQGQPGQALAFLQQTAQADPLDAAARFSLGNCFEQLGRTSEAITEYQAALRASPNDPLLASALAWLLAAAQEPESRNPAQAMELAQHAADATGRTNAAVLRALAAAEAETGQFSDAARTARQALQRANSSRDSNLVTHLEAELKQYESGRPFHLEPRP
jgi:tetratricopeptide (TPR) repeat protein